MKTPSISSAQILHCLPESPSLRCGPQLKILQQVYLLSCARGLPSMHQRVTDVSIEAVAQEVGFGTALSLRLHFQRAYQTSPSNYRKLFRQG